MTDYSRIRTRLRRSNGPAFVFPRRPQSTSSRHFVFFFASVLTCLSMFAYSTSRCTAAEGLADVADSSGGVVVGINGHYRVGRVTAIHVDESNWPTDVPWTESRSDLKLETLDGDGVRARYDCFPTPDRSEETGELGYVVPGSEAAPLVIRRITEAEPDGGVVVQTRFPIFGVPSRGPSMIPSTMPWVITIGDTLGVETIGSSNVLRDKAARVAVTRIDAAKSLPTQPMGFDGVDLVMINATGLPVLESMTSGQINALVDWTYRGGKLLVCLGQATEQIREAAPWLIDLLPVEEITVSRYDPAAFEMYTASQNPLAEFQGIKLPRRSGRVVVAGRTTRRISAVQAAQFVVGFGHVTVVAADLDRPEFAQWPERLRLVSQVIGGLFDEQSVDRDGRDRSTSFGDLVGQMRGTLDQFAIKPKYSFSLVSLVLMLLIAAIGPLDYLLSTLR